MEHVLLRNVCKSAKFFFKKYSLVGERGNMMGHFTLRDVCEYARISIPEQYRADAEYVFPMITCSAGQVIKGGGFFERGLLENGTPAARPYKERMARRAYNNGAKYIFSSENYDKENGEPLPCIVVSEPIKLFKQLCIVIRSRFSSETTVTTVTGSVGKTTTKDLVSLVAAEQFKTLSSVENSNGFASIANYMQRVEDSTQVYIQEVGAFYPGLVENEAETLQPDSVIITNIGKPHVDLYGSVENILYDKMGLVRHMREGGMAFLNFDDPMLRACKPECDITWCSLDNKDADYYSGNLTFDDGFMEFDIMGRCSPTRVRLHSYGFHNVINSVVAFAYGRWLGIPEEKIVGALGKYKAAGLRQNLENIGGYHLYIDCYNSAPNSVIGSIKTIMRVPVEKGKRRIVVFGDIPRMGNEAAEVHTQCGKEIAKYDVDLYLCFGPYMRYMAKELKKAGRAVLYTNHREQLNLWLAQKANIGDLILFKAGHPSHLAKTIDQVYGTSYHITDGDVIVDTGRNFKTEKFAGKIIDNMVEIRQVLTESEEVEVPNSIENKPVVRIGSNSFSRKHKLKRLIVGEGIINIGVGAFYICPNLNSVQLPTSLKIIERSGFNYCTKLEEIVLPDSVISLGRRAFYDCQELKKIVIGENVNFIGQEAFCNCPHLTIYGVKGSYAEEYARKESIPFQVLTQQ